MKIHPKNNWKMTMFWWRYISGDWRVICNLLVKMIFTKFWIKTPQFERKWPKKSTHWKLKQWKPEKVGPKKWDFWKFSVLNTIVLVLTIWWAQIFLNSAQFVPVAAVYRHFDCFCNTFFQTPTTSAWSGLLRHFQCSKWLTSHRLTDGPNFI